MKLYLRFNSWLSDWKPPLNTNVRRHIKKLVILNEATIKSQNAFKALSSEVLRSNNEAFLELVKTTLERYQTETKGDLEQRQKSVENLVTKILKKLHR